MRKLIFFVVSSLLVFAITIFFRLGGHKNVEIEVAHYPDLHFLYKEHIGAYHKINDVIQVVEAWAAENHIPCPRTFGQYLDDPRLIEERRLRSLGGCVLEGSIEFLDHFSKQNQKMDQLDLSYALIPSRKYVVARFDGAPSIGPMKVYPKVEKFLSENNWALDGSVIEIYTIKSKNKALTEYLFPYKGR